MRDNSTSPVNLACRLGAALICIVIAACGGGGGAGAPMAPPATPAPTGLSYSSPQIYPVGIAIAVGFAWLDVQGVRGTFEYHRLRRLWRAEQDRR